MDNMMTHENDNSDARHFSRIQFSKPVSLSNANNKWQCELIDISLHGALTSRPDDWHGKVDEIYQLDLILSDDSKIVMEVKAVHIEQRSLGFSCNHISLDSVTHLRRLVELNLGNEKILERELNELLHVNE